jgi:flagellar biosynthesis GTPase FlhF
VPAGTLVLSSGLGGVYPKGIPVGTVTGVVREQAGWERVYRLLPAANPGAVAHVMVLVSPPGTSLESAFPSDSALQAMRLDSIAKVRQADSIAAAKVEAAKAAAAARAAAQQVAAENAAAQKAAAEKAAAEKAAAEKAAAEKAAAQKAAAEKAAARKAAAGAAPPAPAPPTPSAGDSGR